MHRHAHGAQMERFIMTTATDISAADAGSDVKANANARLIPE